MASPPCFSAIEQDSTLDAAGSAHGIAAANDDLATWARVSDVHAAGEAKRKNAAADRGEREDEQRKALLENRR